MMGRISILTCLLLVTVTAVMAQTKKPAVAAGRLAKGQALYKQHCMSCHQENGSGVPRMNPPLIKTEYVLGDKNRLIGVLLKGLNEEVEINGDYYSNPMPSQAALKDEEIADILTYVRSSFGNKASAVAPADVKKVRATIQ
ncbi:c-type cytochrome [Chitinophaga sp. ysch24]|uniref:C-type cytochrome n=2 Tax=Chitinophaga tropicalis TaxID=2683588 RepID=A0A7K1U0Z7_9BACT|nr:c-type cytochrome [Chitinophaga tropicalis]